MLKKLRLYTYFIIVISIIFIPIFFFSKKSAKSDENSLISVVITVYNTEKYLNKCLDSVINQTYKNLEIICVNDGSKDNSLQILNDYKNKDSRIKVIDKPNGGVSSARNAGLDVATGKYISFIDSDDYIEPNMYEVCISKFNQSDNNVDIITFGYKNVPEKKFRPINSGIFDANEFLDLKYPIGYIWNSIFKKSIINNNSIRFAEDVSIAEDNLFILMYLLVSNKIAIIENRFYNYVDTGFSSKYSSEKSLNSLVNCGIHLINYCISKGIQNQYEWALTFAIREAYNKIEDIIDKNDINKKKEYSRKIINAISDEKLKSTVDNVSDDIKKKINILKSYCS